MNSLLKLVLVFGVFVLSACSNMNKIMKSTDYAYKLKMADQFYNNKKYLKAQMLYEDVMPIIKGTAEYELAYYRWAYTSFYQKDYLNSENLFKGFSEAFPQSKLREEVDFMRAYSLYKLSPKPELDQTPTTRAITYLQTFLNENPNSTRAKEASDLIDQLRAKLETKDFKSAQLYYDLGYYRAAATAFTELMFNFPDSKVSDSYKLKVIESWYKFAENSYADKQIERFESVLNEVADFYDRFPESGLSASVQKIKTDSENKIKKLQDEQITQATGN